MVAEMLPQRDEESVQCVRGKMERDYDIHIIKSKVQELGKRAIEDAVSIFIIVDKNWVRINPYKFAAEIFAEKIILGMSQAEIKRLAYKKLHRTHKVIRDLEIFDASASLIA